MTKQTLGTRRRRLLSLCLALVMTLGLLPLRVWAGYSEVWTYNSETSEPNPLESGVILTAGDVIRVKNLQETDVVRYVYHWHNGTAAGTTNKGNTDHYSDPTTNSFDVVSRLDNNDPEYDYYQVGDIESNDALDGNDGDTSVEPRFTIHLWGYWTVTFDLNSPAAGVTPTGKPDDGYFPVQKYGADYWAADDKPSDPSATGYLFTGWYLEATCENKFVFDVEKDISGNTIHSGTKIQKNMTLYAGWVPAEVSAPIFDPEDGEVFYERGRVWLACETDDATIYYRTEPATPETASGLDEADEPEWTEYSADYGIYITEDTTVYAYAALLDSEAATTAPTALAESEVVSATYTVKPALSVDDVKFGNLKVGYDPEDEETAINLTNKSSNLLVIVPSAPTLTAGDKDCFTIEYRPVTDGEGEATEKQIVTIEPGNTNCDYSIFPAEDLKPGKYSATLSVGYWCDSLQQASLDGAAEDNETAQMKYVTATVTLTVTAAANYKIAFHANGGKGEMDDQVCYTTSVRLNPNEFEGPARKPHFAGWSMDRSSTLADYLDEGTFTYAGEDDVVDLYAIWTDQLHSIEGNLTSYYKGVADGAVTLELWRGTYKLAETTVELTETNSDGLYANTYAFDGIQSGIYNLVAKQPVSGVKEGETIKLQEYQADAEYKTTLEKTAGVDLDGDTGAVDIALPQYEANSILSVTDSPKLPRFVVFGLDTLAEDYFGTAEGAVNIEMAVAEGDQALLTDAVKQLGSVDKTKTKAWVMELTLNGTKKLYSTEQEQELELELLPIDPDDYSLEIAVPIPQGLNLIIVLREHNGEVEALTKKPNERGEYYRIEGNMMYVHINKFCNLAIACGRRAGGSTPSYYDEPGEEALYNIKVLDTVNGTVKSDYEKAKKGQLITLTVKPDDGFELTAIQVLDEVGREVKLTDKGNGIYTFEMPAMDVNVSSVFTAKEPEPEPEPEPENKDCPRDETCPMYPYGDLDRWAWYHDGVHYVLERGIMSGMGKGLFAPDGTTTRAQLAMILWNMEGRPGVNYAIGYGDVSGDDWFCEAVRWASAEGIVGGYGDGKFGPDNAVTREQLVTILYRYAQYKGVAHSPDANILNYDDVFEVNSWAVEAFRWAVENGLVSGIGGNLLAPRENATRAQIATIIMRYCESVA